MYEEFQLLHVDGSRRVPRLSPSPMPTRRTVLKRKRERKYVLKEILTQLKDKTIMLIIRDVCSGQATVLLFVFPADSKKVGLLDHKPFIYQGHLNPLPECISLLIFTEKDFFPSLKQPNFP